MSAKCIFNYVTVGSWNIQGVYEKVNGIKVCKLNDTTFHNTLKKFDILCLQETHLPQDENLPQFEDHITIPHCRKMSANNRYFGGLLIFIRKSIRDGAKIEPTTVDNDVFKITLSKTFFGLPQDRKIIFTYASPINSCYTTSRYINVLEKYWLLF